MQDFNQSQLLQLASEWCHVPLEIIELNLFQESEEVSLSWHLTQSEKIQIEESLNASENLNRFDYIVDQIK